jgi:hypothetical protein
MLVRLRLKLKSVCEKQLRIAFHAFSPLSHHQYFPITFPTILTLPKLFTERLQINITIDLTSIFYLPHIVPLCIFSSLSPPTLSHYMVLYPPKIFLLWLQINVTIDLTLIFYLPQTIPLSRFLLQQPRFKILQKPPHIGRHQFESKPFLLCPFFFPNED